RRRRGGRRRGWTRNHARLSRGWTTTEVGQLWIIRHRCADLCPPAGGGASAQATRAGGSPPRPTSATITLELVRGWPVGRRKGHAMALDTIEDFAVVAYVEEQAWQVGVLPESLTEDLDGLVAALRQQPGEGGALGLVHVA